MATKNYQWAAAVTVESGGYQGELISIEQNGVEIFSGSVNTSQVPKTFNVPWTTTNDETGTSTYTYTYRDSDTMNNNQSTKVAITVTDQWAVSIDKNNVMTVTVRTVMDSAVRTVIGSPSNANRHIWMRRKSNGNDFSPFPLIDNASTAHIIASNVDMGTYAFTLQPGESAQNATVWWRSSIVGHEGDHIPNIYTDILRVGIHFKNILPKDYVPGQIWNDTSTDIETKTGTNITFTGTVHAPFEDLKVNGNITQQTYSGKNMLNGAYGSQIQLQRCTGESYLNGIKITRTQATGAAYVSFAIPNNLLGETLTLSFQKSGFANTSAKVYNYSNNQAQTQIANLTDSGGTFTLPDAIPENRDGFCVVLYIDTGSVDNYASFWDIQLEISSSPSSFEPYVGGVPSPNPAYPQDIDVVTGTQTVTVSNGQGQTQNFTIGLGSIELCKIDNYQDYIYSVDGTWYIHKEVGAYKITGSEGWTMPNTSSYPHLYQVSMSGIISIASTYTTQSITTHAYCKYLEQQTSPNVRTTQGFAIYDPSSPYMRLNNSNLTTIAGFQSWVQANDVVVYYALATPTDTKITDITLIAQLNAIKSYGSYNGDTIISVSGNIASPLTISAKVFSDQGTWLSHNRTNGTAEIYNGSTWPQMRTYDGAVGTGNPPTIEHSDEIWYNQRRIGEE